MMRYGGFSEPFEVQVAIYRELQKQNELIAENNSLLKELTKSRPQESEKPKRGRPRKEGVKDEPARSGRGNHRKTTA